jgi:tetratricopeptide (TPR) repeat protein
VEGHYWLALNLGGVAENSRAALALSLVPMIVDALEIAVTLDEAYDQGGPHRVIGRIYSQAPAWPISVGDLDKSLQHLRRAVQIAPENITNRLYLAETLIQSGMNEEASIELEKILASSYSSPMTDGFERDRIRAIRLIADLRGNE